MSTPDQDKAPLPPAAEAVQGCLFLPGCLGQIFGVVLALTTGAYLIGLLFSLVAGGRAPDFPIRQSAYEWFKLGLIILSWVVYHSLRTKKQFPYVFWLTTACGLGWIGLIAFSEPSYITQRSPGTPERPLMDSRWIIVFVIALFLLQFTLSRQNHRYFRLTDRPPAL
ncbi:MAG: hypothetical protein IPK32_25540 [Verrucomicrobiaceae bacterium]|nr:hypothetical protein [Verrucomicrobiaceae bacterium]